MRRPMNFRVHNGSVTHRNRTTSIKIPCSFFPNRDNIFHRNRSCECCRFFQHLLVGNHASGGFYGCTSKLLPKNAIIRMECSHRSATFGKINFHRGINFHVYRSLKAVELIQLADSRCCFALQVFQRNNKVHSQVRSQLTHFLLAQCTFAGQFIIGA